MTEQQKFLGWFGVFRLGLVQTAIGAIVILMTSTINRVMVVELLLPAVVPGALVGWHYAVQMSRPRWGYGSDMGGARTPWIIGGVGVLALGAVLAAVATSLVPVTAIGGGILSVIAFFIIGVGVGASGTNLLALLATRVAPARKAAAAAIVWIMMIFGFVLTAAIAGSLLDPFSMERLINVTGGVAALAFVVTLGAVWRIERPNENVAPGTTSQKPEPFRKALGDIWQETQARRFTIFIFVSMLAYSAQDLILEPFAGLIYNYSPGESTQLAGVQNGGVLIGMIITAIIGTTIGKSRAGFMRLWTTAGCMASAVALASLAFGAMVGTAWPLKANIFALGLSNGVFAVAAIGSMMTLASAGQKGREGTRMGLWGASQAISFGLGGFLGAVAIDISRQFFEDPAGAFSLVFAAEGAFFVLAAFLSIRVGRSDADEMTLPVLPAGEHVPAE